MRSGAYTLQQTLTTEAASVLKHSLTLSRRRGHSQVTPLHVAAILLTSKTSLLRRACLKSQPHHQISHPLHCRALELCFNVALNRLPTTPSSPLLHSQPSLSNALIAALKRAQALQRRGSIEQQQQQQQKQEQPLLAIRVDLEQLILSILDDPSVSRVMREAGFSSTAIKNNLEDFNSSCSSVFQCYNSSGGIYSSPSLTENPRNLWHTHFLNCNSEQNPVFISHQKRFSRNPNITDSDIKLVLEVLLRKKRKNTVIIGDSASLTEGLVLEIMGKVERKEEVPEELKSVHFIRFQISSVPLMFMKREEVEKNLSDLKRKVDSLASVGGVIIYTGDLKWTIDTNVSERDRQGSGYSPIDHLVEEIGRLVSEYNSSSTKVWLMGTSNYETYMKCQMRSPPLEIQWALQAVSVPSGGLGLTLHATSVHDPRFSFTQNPSQAVERKPITSKEEEDNKLTCCEECKSNYEKDSELFKSAHQRPSSLFLSSCNSDDSDKGSSKLPYWLQSHDSQTRQKDGLVELRRKWNRLCQSLHQRKQTQNNLNSSSFNKQSFLGNTYSSSHSWWPNQKTIFPYSNSISFADSNLKPNHIASSIPRFRRQKSCHIEFSFSSGDQKHQSVEPNLDSLKSTEGKEVKITLELGNSLFSESGKFAAERNERTTKQGEVCKVLQQNVPWQSEVIPSIVEGLMDSDSIKRQSWLLIEGDDSIGKRRLALAIAESVFGSADLLFHMKMKNRHNKADRCPEILEEALKNHEKLVVLVEDVDFANTQFIKFLADGLEIGKFGELDKKEVIFILTKGEFTCSEDDKKNPNSVIQMKLEVSEAIQHLGKPKFDHKRKVDWDLSNEAESQKINEKGNSKKQFTRQLSSNTLDLNIRADEDDDEIGEISEECSPVSSDLTGEFANDLQNPLGFLELIKNRFIFNRNSNGESQIKGMVLNKLQGTFKDVFGSEKIDYFTVEEMALEEVLFGSGCFLNSLFEKWVKEVFQTSLKRFQFGGKENMNVRLCFGGKGESNLEDRFMGSTLPKKIQVSFV